MLGNSKWCSADDYEAVSAGGLAEELWSSDGSAIPSPHRCIVLNTS